MSLECRNLTRTFPGGAGVNGIDLAVASGEVHALVGLNGAGKTTLMRLLLGMLRPDRGSIQLGGKPIRQLRAADWARVGHVVGHPLTYPELTVRANLTVGAGLQAVPPRRVPGVVDRALTDFDLVPYADRHVRVLSAGNAQRVGLAIALQHAPTVVVLDEPTSALDPAGVILLRDRLRHCAEAGAAVLVSSHHLDEVARVADRITLVNRGRGIGDLAPGDHDLERQFFARILDDDQHAGAR